MKETQLKLVTNDHILYNVPHFLAIAYGFRVGQWGWHNLKYRFWPPKPRAVMLRPNDPKQKLDDSFEEITPEMVSRGGFLHERPLNYWIAFEEPSGFRMNAGYIHTHFGCAETLGWEEVARLVKAARKEVRREKTEAAPSGDPATAQGDNSV